MTGSRSSVDELIREASAARARGDEEAARAAYARAYDAARQVRDPAAMSESALGLASGHQFGTHPGRVPAFLHEAYSLAVGEQRIRLAVALARAWVYGGDPDRAVKFAAEAVAAANRVGDPALLADALDAELLVHWGPDDLAARLRITARLEDTVAHLADVPARLSCHLWRLTTALECLDAVTVQRQLRALDALAEQSGDVRVRFFAASRRGMQALLVDDLPAAGRLMAECRRLGAEAGEPDALAIERTLTAGIARQAGDLEALAAEAAAFEAFGTREGIPSITAEAAALWLAAGDPARAWSLLEQVAGPDFGALPRDVDWLLTMVTLTDVAAGTGAAGLAEEGVRQLQPYAGRGVVNAGAVSFHGVVDGCLHRACVALGRSEEAEGWARTAAGHYQRLGARWLLRQVRQPRPASVPLKAAQLRPGTGGIWSVGSEGAVVAVPESRGLQYLRALLAQPGVEIAALDLSDRVAGHAGAGVVADSLGEVIDRQALAAYRSRLLEIDEELDEAGSWGDAGRLELLSGERQALLDEVSSATGLGGRLRRTGSAGERARVAVRKAVAAAIERIELQEPSLGRLLRDTIHTGMFCRYLPDPDRPVRWVLDPSGHPPGPG